MDKRWETLLATYRALYLLLLPCELPLSQTPIRYRSTTHFCGTDTVIRVLSSCKVCTPFVTLTCHFSGFDFEALSHR